MPADAPTILATSGGVVASPRNKWSVGPLTRYAVDLAGVEGRAPRVSLPGDRVRRPAGGDPRLLRHGAGGGVPRQPPLAVHHAQRRRHPRAPARPGRDLGLGRKRRGPAGDVGACTAWAR
ncbi:hypothetical protein [Nocardioides convexus]|uniref:hypothetical protein n=1 Tax=Nocardioides convexus TaxID=2712224 RepID=UPI002418B19B|nr:hypothetical protein [Nocardioides convexus]